jgi:hypothetical protein
VNFPSTSRVITIIRDANVLAVVLLPVLFFTILPLMKDKRLRRAVAVHGKNWSKAAEEVGEGVSGEQCYLRWKLSVDPVVAALKACRGPWSQEEVGTVTRGNDASFSQPDDH